MSLPLHRSSVASCCVLFEAGVSSGCVIAVLSQQMMQVLVQYTDAKAELDEECAFYGCWKGFITAF